MYSREIVTLNIESTDVRFLVVHGKKVKKWGSVYLEPGLVKEGLIVNVPAVSEVISQFMAEQGVKGEKVIASLSGFQSIQRFSDLPRLPDKLMEEALSRKAETEMPVPLEQLYLSWQAVDYRDESQRVFLLGTPRNLVDAEVQCFLQSGFTPQIIDLKPLALARMVNRAEALIIDIEMESSDIIVVSGSIPTLMRTITMHSERSSASRVQYLVEEFERTLQFYDSSHPDEPLSPTTPLFLTGGLDDAEIVQAVAAGVEYKTEPLVSPLECPPDLPLAQYAGNIGLALKKVSPAESPSIPDVNILPDIYRRHRAPAKPILFGLGVIAGIALLFPLYQVANSASTEVHRLQADYSDVSHQLKLRQLESQEIKQIEDAIAQVQQSGENLDVKIEELSSQRSSAYDNLQLVAVDTLPADANLTSITLEDGQLRLQGDAASPRVALDYAYALRQTGKFYTVWVNSLSAGEDKVSFSITLK